MPRQVLRQWDVLEVVNDDVFVVGRYRIVLVEESRNALYLLPVSADPKARPPLNGLPRAFDHGFIAAALATGQVRLIENPLPFKMTVVEGLGTKGEDRLPRSAKIKLNRNWEIIKHLTEPAEYPAIVCDSEMRSAAFLRVAKAHSIAEKTVRRLMLRYWYFGGKHGLTGLYDRCGAPGVPRPSNGGTKRGRPPRAVATEHDLMLTGVNATSDDIKVVRDLARTKIIKAGWAIRDTFDHMKDEYCVDQSIEADGTVVATPRSVNSIITYNQFYYYYSQYRNELETQQLLAGKEWNLKRRHLHASARFGVFGPGDRFEIDATIANTWLVSRYDRHKLIGRPVVYLICDTWSRYIVGIHVALEGPSWETARLAICNAFSPKREFLISIGMKDATELTWETPDFCHRLVSDRGEVLSRKGQAALQEGLGLDSGIAPAARGDMKGVVERRFGIVDTKLSWLAGGYRKRAREACDSPGDPRLTAKLDIVQFANILVEEVLYANDVETRFELLLPGMRETDSDFLPTAKNMYFWGREHLSGLHGRSHPASRDRHRVFASLLPSKECPVTRQGIQFSRGRNYVSEILVRRGLFSRVKESEKAASTVRLYYDDLFPEHMLMLDREADTWEPVHLREADRPRFGSLSEYEIQDMLAIEALSERGNADLKNVKRHGKTKRQKEIVAEATRQQESEPAPTKTHKLKNVRDHRNSEADLERTRGRKLYSPALPQSTEAKAAESESAPKPRADVVDLMERLRQRRGK